MVGAFCPRFRSTSQEAHHVLEFIPSNQSGSTTARRNDDNIHFNPSDVPENRVCAVVGVCVGGVHRICFTRSLVGHSEFFLAFPRMFAGVNIAVEVKSFMISHIGERKPRHLSIFHMFQWVRRESSIEVLDHVR